MRKYVLGYTYIHLSTLQKLHTKKPVFQLWIYLFHTLSKRIFLWWNKIKEKIHHLKSLMKWNDGWVVWTNFDMHNRFLSVPLSWYGTFCKIFWCRLSREMTSRSSFPFQLVNDLIYQFFLSFHLGLMLNGWQRRQSIHIHVKSQVYSFPNRLHSSCLLFSEWSHSWKSILKSFPTLSYWFSTQMLLISTICWVWNKIVCMKSNAKGMNPPNPVEDYKS